ncbi:hypothetical protein V6N11_003526 [Hibiscus sabdariffa]|uniref:Uncharacterized protein n=1 Tax=Hibiscus sabdariffa TaxID=183260 RepID=A0ABR2SE92_9ROSI
MVKGPVRFPTGQRVISDADHIDSVWQSMRSKANICSFVANFWHPASNMGKKLMTSTLTSLQNEKDKFELQLLLENDLSPNSNGIASPMAYGGSQSNSA